MKDVGTITHNLDVGWGTVNTLAVHYGPLKHVGEFHSAAEKIRSHKVDHAPVLLQVILQGVARHNDTSSVKKSISNLYI